MASKSKAKGNAWEYAAADKLTEIFGRNFRRNTSGSGAMFGGDNFGIKLNGRDTSQVLNGLGDIVPPTGYYVVSECKNYAEFDFHKILLGQGHKTVLWDWIEEVRHDARLDRNVDETHLPHWLLWKVTRRGEYMALPATYFSGIFDLPRPTPIPHAVYNHVKTNPEDKMDLRFIETYYILPFDQLEAVKEGIVQVVSDSKYFSDNILDLVK